MALYPVFLKLEGRKVLIVGGGAVAEQKIEGVLRSATDVTVIAPEVTPRIREWAQQGRLNHVPQEFRAGMAEGYFLVIAATDSPAVNHAVYDQARASGALCNAVDDTPYCDFYAPALVSRGEFQIAISTGGSSPALAQRVRKNLETQYGAEYESWTAWLGRMRSMLRRALPAAESRKELLRLLALSRPQMNDGNNPTGRKSGAHATQ
ncbi:MAG TPA: bifunctional precorrin-2 dehydrogenase/sirohydrochlorin ferrochelatase [Candidatus Angelobacter sp.]|nr:bifunctional precorrin-2 dehydrogenase/sirohydrochlorin ferrochelatase [Candidatus Angelobacter sp.]